VQHRFGSIDSLLLVSVSSPRSRVVPRPIGEFDFTDIMTTIHVGPHVIHQDGIEDRDVGVEVTLLKAIDQDTRSWWRDLDSGVGNSLPFLVEGKENFACCL